MTEPPPPKKMTEPTHLPASGWKGLREHLSQILPIAPADLSLLNKMMFKFWVPCLLTEKPLFIKL